MRAFDPLNILGGDTSAQAELQDKLEASRARQAQALQELQDYIQQTTQQNQALWGNYGSGLADYSKQLSDILGSQKGAYSNLADSLGNYRSVEDLLRAQPQLAQHDTQSRFNEAQNLGKIGALTGTKETAEEQFMRAVARQNMENQLRGQRESVASSLKQRGTYGGGSELAMALAGQQEAAGRRSMEDMGANANAQKRAMSALGMYQQGAGAMSAADDALSKFNSSLLQQHSQAQAAARGQDNTAQANRATGLYNAATSTNAMANQNVNNVRQDARATVQGKTGVNTNAMQSMGDLYGLKNQAEQGIQAQNIAEEPSGGFLSGLLKIF
jgi:hypothetical protein